MATHRDVPTLGETLVPIRSMDELVPLRRFERDPSNPLTPGQVRTLVRKDSSHPEFRRALVQVGKSHLVHVPSWMRALELYRLNQSAAA